MGLIEELEEMDEEKETNDLNVDNEKKKRSKRIEDLKGKYRINSRLLRNRVKLKEILEADNPELDEPILVKETRKGRVLTDRAIANGEKIRRNREGYAKINNIEDYMNTEPYSRDLVLTKRVLTVLNLIVKMSGEQGQDKPTYKKSYRIPTEKDKKEMMHIKKKVKAIYESDEKDSKCVSAIDSNRHWYGKTWIYLPTVETYFKDTWGKTGLGIDTTLKYALLANVGSKNAFDVIIQEPEKIQEYENEIKRLNMEKEMASRELSTTRGNNSKITFATIKSAIKEHLLGKGER